MQFFPQNIHRIGFLNLKSHFSLKIFIGLDSSIRDLVDLLGSANGVNFFRDFEKVGKNYFPPGKIIEANSSQSCF